MAWISRSLLLSFLVLVAACSTPEDRAFAMRFVEDVRRGDEKALKPQFDPELWATSREKLPLARPLFPPTKGSTRLEGYHVFTEVTNGASSTRKEFILVTTDRTHWTRTRVATLAEGGPARVVEWNVKGFKGPAPEVQMAENMERLVPWLQAGALFGLIGGIGIAWWLVRRWRRRAAAGP
jgi:hypothetical protein